jgi:hypothetical protein
VGLGQQIRKPFDKIFTVSIIPEDLPSFYPPDHDMMKKTGGI